MKAITRRETSTSLADDEKAVQNTEGECWDGEEIHRSNGLTMVSEKRQPSLHRVWIPRGSPNPSVTPRTVVNWHRAGFRLYWAWVLKVREVGCRKRVSKEVRALIFRVVAVRHSFPRHGNPA
jgi:hypothetical protein